MFGDNSFGIIISNLGRRSCCNHKQGFYDRFGSFVSSIRAYKSFWNRLFGNPDPSGGEVTSYGNLFAVLTLWLFASIGGFQIVTGTIYTSYDIWAVNTVFPSFVPGGDVLLEILEHIFLNAVVLAGPLLVIMFLSDIIHLIGAKFGKNIDVGHLTFSTKNLIAMMILPLFLVMSIRLFKDNLGFLATVPDLVQGIIR